MKKLILIPLVAIALFLNSCASLQNIQQILGTPQSVQAEITLIGGVVKTHVSPAIQIKIHQAATYLVQAANLDLSTLFNLLPATTGSWNGDLLITKVKETVTAIVNRYGSQNPTTIAYAKAIGNGLLANF